MIKEKAEELVAALRSGEYKQGRSALRRNDKFCCLGVACDISGLGAWGEPFDLKGCELNGMLGFRIGSSQASTRSLPDPVKEYFGFRSALGQSARAVDLGDGPVNVNLAMLNDDGKSFLEIADFIEANWEVL